MNRALFGLVFISGIVVAMVAVLISDYLISGRVGGSKRNILANLLPNLSSFDSLEEDHSFILKGSHNELEISKPRDVFDARNKCQSDEAMKTVKAAIKTDNNSPGGLRRATKLFNHAVALCPKHPKVLNHYGEFLESTSDDLLEADHLYVQAISYSLKDSEDHSRALQNRKRTAVIVEEIDRRQLQRIDDKKKHFQRISSTSSSSSLRRAKKEAYFQHVFHTVAIEGNTMTLAQIRAVLETGIAVPGKSVMEHNEVLGLDSALRYINQTLVDKFGEITLDDILQIHKRVLGHVDPIEGGLIRRTQVYIGDHVPPSPTNVEVLLQRFVMWLNSEETLEMHPVKFSALAHYKFVYIHPFVDGNGRTSRLLMNLILMQHGFPPIIIRKQDRLVYFRHIVKANEGDVRPFIRFIADCTEKTLDAYIEASQELRHGDQHGLKVFNDDAEVIQVLDHFDHHDTILLGGSIGSNVTVET